MVNQRKHVINSNVHLVQETARLRISKSYAERHLSKSALKYAEQVGNYYDFIWGRSSYIVAFELPKLFNFQFLEVMRYLISYCNRYVVENNLTDSVMFPTYVANMNKAVK